jgi:hypothetical protein|eukprot:COSAG02_NODE_10304_length_1974_cov_1.641067_3_plen_96_part_00
MAILLAPASCPDVPSRPGLHRASTVKLFAWNTVFLVPPAAAAPGSRRHRCGRPKTQNHGRQTGPLSTVLPVVSAYCLLLTAGIHDRCESVRARCF